MKAVVKVSGYAFDLSDAALRREVSEISGVLLEKLGERDVFHVVVGGGPLARRYIEAARENGAAEAVLDELGIMVSRINAKLFLSFLGEEGHPSPLATLEEISTTSREGKVTVSGGLHPGISTNAVSALSAEVLSADLLVTLTRAGGVYDRDPEVHEDATMFDSVTPGELREVLEGSWERAGRYFLFDQVALNVVRRSEIPTVVTDVSAESLEKALDSERTGTRVVFDG